MGARTVHKVCIEWGDTDPARIVFYPNYFRWFDAAAHHLFDEIGISHNEIVDGGGVGFPIVEAHSEFKRPGYFADHIEIHAEIVEVGSKVMKVAYRAIRPATKQGESDTVLLEGYEKRVIAVPHKDDPKRISAITIDEAMRAKLLAE